jgi:NAD-dependent deacetylase
MRRRVAAAAKPNPAHLAIAQLQRAMPERMFLCTQNVDNLHEQAGAQQVHHMHGELFRSRCDTCDRKPFADTQVYEPPQPVPLCECGGQIRPHICWFGEMPYDLDIAFAALRNCTVFMAVGTSGVVEPASSFVRFAHDLHARTIYVGPEKPANAFFFSDTHLGKAGELLPVLL